MLSPGEALAQTPEVGQAVEGPVVIEAWVDAVDAQDVAAALSLLAEESFLILSTVEGDSIDTYAGKAEIEELLQVYAMDNMRVRLERTPQEENGTTFWTESRTSDRLGMLGIPAAEYVGEALISGGKIMSLIYTPTPETEAAIARATGVEPTGMPRSGVDALNGDSWAAWIGIGLWSVLAGICLLVFNRREERQPA
ncbi:MAG TPA: hypothetical protein VJ183_17560 [Chloroflexia bacterium]|nr:hypothetical protein [Chloroflexia bacterium]